MSNLPGAGTLFSCVAVIIVCRNSISFLKTSINSTIPLLPMLNAPVKFKTRGSSSEYLSNFEISSEPIKTDTSCELASIGGTEAIPLRPR